MSRVLCIGDIHAPFTEKRYLEHCKLVYKEYKCDKVVFLGDILDNHAVSHYAKSSESEGSKSEILMAKEYLQEWVQAFPNAFICTGNHDDRHLKAGANEGISEDFFKSMNELTATPKGWKWGSSVIIDGVKYAHGHGGKGGRTPHLVQAERIRRSLVIGHFHSVSGIEWSATDDDIIFGMCVGCGIDSHAYAFDYAKNGQNKPIIAVGVVIDGWLPILIKRNLGSKIRRVK